MFIIQKFLKKPDLLKVCTPIIDFIKRIVQVKQYHRTFYEISSVHHTILLMVLKMPVILVLQKSYYGLSLLKHYLKKYVLMKKEVIWGKLGFGHGSTFY